MSDRLATNPRLEHDADDGGYWNRRSFSYSDVSPARRIVIGLAIALVVMFLAALGYIVNGWSWQDAIYMVVITVFGVGYGETQPIDTPLLRWLTITLIV
ncbi:MAG: potassium channel family protein [Planctomycetota bacterium]